MQNKISVITVCYNDPGAEKTSKSVISQTFKDFEWIVIDGGSNKETLDVFDKHKERINVFVSEKDNGVYNAMNKGIKKASGEYLIFMNAGDTFYDENVLQNFVNGGLDREIIYGNCFVTTGDGWLCKYPDELDKNFWITRCLNHQSCLIKRSLFEKYGLYDENYKIVSDYEKWLKFIYENNASCKHADFTASRYDTSGISGNVKTRNLTIGERESVVDKYFTEKEIRKAFLSVKLEYTFLQKIFSIKKIPNHMHKIITILGFRIFLRRKHA